jgi:S-adenosylmethionine:tRNA ribosyltransferase-isomerase
MPIPPYLDRRAEPIDRERYQTVYACAPGAVAAPTAGLHLTEPLIQQMKERGTDLVSLTLHVGPGTFRPVKSERIADHHMDEEAYDISAETAERIEETRHQGGRIVAVGTTVVRVLESVAQKSEESGEKDLIRKSTGTTRLFIRPGHRFRSVDVLLTNFHLPRSTLLMLVAAFSERDRVLGVYREAQMAGYRFYSYGDAMLIQ